MNLLSRTMPWLIVLASIIVMLVYVLLGHYAHPSADDYCMANGVQSSGLISHLLHHYAEWSGRYASNTLYALYPMIFGFADGYQVMPAAIILLLLLATAFFLSSLFRIRLLLPLNLLIAVSFTAIFILGMRDTASSLYWTAGAMTYQSANILLLLMLGLMIRLHDSQSAQRGIGVTSGLLVAVIILGIGTHETNMMLVTGLVLLAFLLQLHRGWHRSRPWLLLLLVAAISSAIVFFAPGNLARTSTFPMSHDLMRSLEGSYVMGLKTLRIWLGSPLLIVATLLTPFATAKLLSLSQRTFQLSGTGLFTLILVTLAVPFVLQFPAWWAMGGYPPARTVDAIYFVFLVCWLATIAALSRHYLFSGLQSFQHGPMSGQLMLVFVISSVLFIAAIATNGKFRRAVGDLLYRAGPYHAYILARYRLIEESIERNEFFLTVPEYDGEYPRSIYYNDIRPHPGDWRNVCYARYYGVSAIRRVKMQNDR